MNAQSDAVKGGWTKVPNSVVENLYVLTPAETAMVLIILRRRDDKDAKKHGGCLISDANWAKWTRLAERQKLNAIKGLAAKGLFIDGKSVDPDSKLPYRGDKARFAFDDSKFRAYVRTFVDPEGRARTVGRPKAVSAPAGFLVHDDCRTNGCQQLCGPKEQRGCIIPLPVPQGSAQGAAVPPAIGDPVPGGNGVFTDSIRGKRSKPAASAATAATAATAANAALPISENILGQMYPTAGLEFLELLAQTCAKTVPQFTDADLAAALDGAWKAKRGAQKAEGLFLKTVPPLLGRIVESRLAYEKQQAAAQAEFDALPDHFKRVNAWCNLLWAFRASDSGGNVHHADFQDIASRLDQGYSKEMEIADMERLFVSVEAETIERAVKFLRAVDPKGWAADLSTAASTLPPRSSAAAVERFAFLQRFSLPGL